MNPPSESPSGASTQGASNTMRGKRIGLLLSTQPSHPNLATVSALGREALRQGVRVYLYLVDDGVETLSTPEIVALSRAGATLFVCAYSAQRRNIPVSDQAVFCGLVALSDIIKGCDRFLAFN